MSVSTTTGLGRLMTRVLLPRSDWRTIYAGERSLQTFSSKKHELDASLQKKWEESLGTSEMEPSRRAGRLKELYERRPDGILRTLHEALSPILAAALKETRTTPEEQRPSKAYVTDGRPTKGHSLTHMTFVKIDGAREIVLNPSLLHALIGSFPNGGSISESVRKDIVAPQRDISGEISHHPLVARRQEVADRIADKVKNKERVDGPAALGDNIIELTGHSAGEVNGTHLQTVLACATTNHALSGVAAWIIGVSSEAPEHIFIATHHTGEHPLNVCNFGDRLNAEIAPHLFNNVFRTALLTISNFDRLKSIYGEHAASEFSMNPQIEQAMREIIFRDNWRLALDRCMFTLSDASAAMLRHYRALFPDAIAVTADGLGSVTGDASLRSLVEQGAETFRKIKQSPDVHETLESHCKSNYFEGSPELASEHERSEQKRKELVKDYNAHGEAIRRNEERRKDVEKTEKDKERRKGALDKLEKERQASEHHQREIEASWHALEKRERERRERSERERREREHRRVLVSA